MSPCAWPALRQGKGWDYADSLIISPRRREVSVRKQPNIPEIAFGQGHRTVQSLELLHPYESMPMALVSRRRAPAEQVVPYQLQYPLTPALSGGPGVTFLSAPA